MLMKKTSETITTSHFDLANPPPLTAEERKELEALRHISDADIDYSDIPPTPEDAQLYRPVKKSTTIRLDADVLLWLKSKGKGYQTRINQILRERMLQERVNPSS